MFHSRTLNSKIKPLYRKALRIVYSDFKAKFDKLLEKDNSFSIHHQNIQTLAYEIFVFFNWISLKMTNGVFYGKPSVPYSLRERMNYIVESQSCDICDWVNFVYDFKK